MILVSQDDAHEFGMNNLIRFLVASLHEKVPPKEVADV